MENKTRGVSFRHNPLAGLGDRAVQYISRQQHNFVLGSMKISRIVFRGQVALHIEQMVQRTLVDMLSVVESFELHCASM